MKRFLLIAFVFSTHVAFSQNQTVEDVEQLKKEIIKLQADVGNIQLNLKEGEKKFKRGILISTIGYSVTIAGGLMLGRKQDELGKVLLVAGGATGVVGTVLMVDAFKYFGRAGRTSRQD